MGLVIDGEQIIRAYTPLQSKNTFCTARIIDFRQSLVNRCTSFLEQLSKRKLQKPWNNCSGAVTGDREKGYVDLVIKIKRFCVEFLLRTAQNLGFRSLVASDAFVDDSESIFRRLDNFNRSPSRNADVNVWFTWTGKWDRENWPTGFHCSCELCILSQITL